MANKKKNVTGAPVPIVSVVQIAHDEIPGEVEFMLGGMRQKHDAFAKAQDAIVDKKPIALQLEVDGVAYRLETKAT